jgi:hypothetical protein
VDEILATEKYVTGYVCKGKQPTGAVIDLFNDMINCADDSTGATAKSICSKLLIRTVKRDVSSIEASLDTYLSMMLFFVKVEFPFELSRILDSEKLAERKVWEDLYSVRPDNSKEASIDDTSLLTVLIRTRKGTCD